MDSPTEFLEGELDKYAANVKRLTAQLNGVEKAIAIESAKLDAVNDALSFVYRKTHKAKT